MFVKLGLRHDLALHLTHLLHALAELAARRAESGVAQPRATQLAVRLLGGELNFRGLGRRSLRRIASGLLGEVVGIGKGA